MCQLNSQRLPVWALLAADHLAVMGLRYQANWPFHQQDYNQQALKLPKGGHC
jgi:hypothetical protein